MQNRFVDLEVGQLRLRSVDATGNITFGRVRTSRVRLQEYVQAILVVVFFARRDEEHLSSGCFLENALASLN